MAKKKSQTTAEENIALRRELADLRNKLATLERGHLWSEQLPLFGTLAGIIEEIARNAAVCAVESHENRYHDTDW